MKEKLVCNWGIYDVDAPTQKEEKLPCGKRKVVWRCVFYTTWAGMIRRCYSESSKIKYPSYLGCSVCDEWKFFSNFKRWMQRQEYKGKELDKDLILKGNKIYSPANCLFLSPNVNTFIITSKSIRGEYPIGVTEYRLKDKVRFVANCRNPITKDRLRKYIGSFDTPFEAHKAWQKKKLEYAIALSNLPENGYLGDLLINRYTFKEDEICYE